MLFQMRMQRRELLIAHVGTELPRLCFDESLAGDELDHRPARLRRLLDGLIDGEAVEGECLTSSGERRGTFGGLGGVESRRGEDE